MKLIISAVSMAVALTLATSVNANTITLSEYTAGQQPSSTSPAITPGYYWGMSLFLDDDGAGFAGYNDLSVSLFGSGGSVGQGDLYAFTSPMLNTSPSDLVNLNAFAVGSGSNGVWEFGNSDYFLSNQYYHFYTDTFISSPVYGFGNAGDVDQGFWYALDADEWANVPDVPDPIPNELINFEYQSSAYLNHSVEGVGVAGIPQSVSIPEPTSLLLLSAGLLGVRIVKRKKRA